MNNEEEQIDIQLQKLKQSILDVSQQKINQNKQPYSFHKQLQNKRKSNIINSFDSNKQIDILQAADYLKLVCHQKKYLSKKRGDKIYQLNQSLHIQQENFKYLFMIVAQANYYKLQYPGYYQQILQQINNYPKNMFNSIEKDIGRTFPNQHPFQSSLKNVLIAFAIRNPNLLYCQGMNYLVAYFLINSVSQQQTFWILVCLIENILPDDYYKDLSTISITTQIFSDVLPYLFPEMGRQMKNIGMDCSLFIVSWYVCLFTKGFINSVSSYLITKLILQSRKHSFGFILLKLSLGIIAAILGRDQPFTCRPQFAAFRDKFQLSVFEISLLQIKLGVEYIELNQENYLKLEKKYRQKKQQRHLQLLQKQIKNKNKRLTLPICSNQYPICLHRIEIQRKLGNVSEVSITKNGYPILSQYIEDYFDNQPKKQSTCSIYSSINDCLMYRHNHICLIQSNNHETTQELCKKLDNKLRLRHDQSFMIQVQKLQYIQQGSSSMQIQIKNTFEKDDQKLRQLSGFFVVDQNFKFGSQQQVQDIQLVQDNNRNIGSSASLQEPFDLAKQLQKHNIQQDWIKNENEFKNIQQMNKIGQQINLDNLANQTGQQKVQTSQQNNEKNQAQKFNSSNNLNLTIESKQSHFFNKQKLWTFLGKTWRKVIKIKQQQLKN